MLNHNYTVGETIVDEKRNLTVIEVDGDMVRVHCNDCNWANNWIRKYNLTKVNRNVVSKFVKSGELYKGLALAYQTEGVLL